MSCIPGLENFGGTARLFPLPNVVLYPGVLLPLHIFEPRYRQMTEDALGGDRLIAMMLLRPGWEPDYEGKPPVFAVGCLGRIVAEERLADGRFNLLLRGLSRMRALRELGDGKLYRTAEAQLLNELAPPETTLEPLRRRLIQAIPAWMPESAPPLQFELMLGGKLPVGAVCDILAFALSLPLELKQELLEELDVSARAVTLAEYLEGHAPGASGGFPPAFSPN